MKPLLHPIVKHSSTLIVSYPLEISNHSFITYLLFSSLIDCFKYWLVDFLHYKS